MNVKNKYISGFTLVEMMMSIIISAAAAVAMMFVYNQSQEKMYNDRIEFDIATYGTRAVNLISNKLLNNLTEEVREIPGGWGGFSAYEISYIDRDKYGNPEDRMVRIKLKDDGGFIISQGNRDITNTVFDGEYLKGGSFKPGEYNQDQHIPTSYIIDEWSIEPLTGDSLFHQINPSKTGALSKSSYAVKIKFIIQTEEEGDFGNSLYKHKTYWAYSFSPYLYLKEKSKNNQEDDI